MRMLTEEEREYLSTPATFSDEGSPEDEQTSAVIEGMLACGRLEIRSGPPGFLEPVNSYFGDRALRIDALIRQWGYGS